MTFRALVVSGAGAYADDWHDFPTTSARVAGALEALGLAVTTTEDVEAELAAPDGADLVVVNVGNPRDARPPDALGAVAAGLRRHLAAGGGLLALHSSATSMTTLPDWPELVGGRWVRGRTGHPPLHEFRVVPTGADHPVTRGLDAFLVTDERYCDLEVRPDATVLGHHAYDGRDHPVVWAREEGPGRVLYDALGHDERSYDAPGHVELLGRAVRWLVPSGPAPGRPS